MGHRPIVAAGGGFDGAGGKGLLPGEEEGGEALDDLGLERSEVVEFGGILCPVEEFEARAIGIHEKFPIAVADGEDGAAIRGVAGDVEAPLPEERVAAESVGPEEDGGAVFAVEVGGVGDVREFGKGREEIGRADDRGGDAGRGDFAGPAGDERDADASVVEAAFATAQGARGAEGGVGSVADMDIFGAVVGGEENDRVLGEVAPVEFSEEAAELVVEIAEGRKVGLMRAALGDGGGVGGRSIQS